LVEQFIGLGFGNLWLPLSEGLSSLFASDSFIEVNGPGPAAGCCEVSGLEILSFVGGKGEFR
jgi:hypothetical protein